MVRSGISAASPKSPLRESYREGGKARNRTLANLSRWPEAKIDALSRLLKGLPLQAAPEAAFEIVRSLPHGHVAAVLGTLRALGLQEVIGPPALALTDLVCAMVAAHRGIANNGLSAASTRAIADEAAVSGGTLYNYFDNRVQLVAKSIVHHAKNLTDPVTDLQSRAGSRTVAQHLRYFVRQAAIALDQLVPVFAAAFSDSALLDALRREMADIDPLSDPARVVERYLLAERDLGRVSSDADCHAAAAIIVSLCHDDAFNRYLYGEGQRPKSRHKEIALIARSPTT